MKSCYQCLPDDEAENIGVTDGKYGICAFCGHKITVFEIENPPLNINPGFLLSDNLDTINDNIALLGTDKIIYIGRAENINKSNPKLFAEFTLEELKYIVKNAEERIKEMN